MVDATVAASRRPRMARRYLWGLTSIFLVLLLVQVYLAGAFLMWDSDYRTAHVALGWTLTYVPFLMVGAAAFGRVGRRVWVLLGVLFVLVHVQPFLAFADRDSLGWLRALHAPVAVLLIVLSHSLMRVTRGLDEPA